MIARKDTAAPTRPRLRRRILKDADTNFDFACHDLMTRLAKYQTAVAVVCVALLLGSAVAQSGDDDEDYSGASGKELYSIQGAIRLPKPNLKAAACRLFVNGGQTVGLVRADGNFVITGLPAGTYLLEIYHPDFVFSAIRVDISAKEKGKVRAAVASTKAKLPYPLSLRPDKPAVYFQQHAPYDWSSMFKNPMVLMMGFTLIMVVVMPRMLNNMDPKELEQMRKMSLTDALRGQTPAAVTASR